MYSNTNKLSKLSADVLCGQPSHRLSYIGR